MYQRYIKRILDIAIGLFVFPLFIIAIIMFTVMIKLDDGGPVFYSSLRIGKDGKLFKMYKFRSMKVDAPDIRFSDGSTYNAEDDPRVTKAGRFMRKTSADELPQIFNMLGGSMSLVGPRPDPPDWLERYPEDVKVFLTAKPGLTGYSQAFFRKSIDAEEKMKIDVYYATHCSFLLDAKIVLKSFASVVKKGNIYRDGDYGRDNYNDMAEDESDE